MRVEEYKSLVRHIGNRVGSEKVHTHYSADNGVVSNLEIAVFVNGENVFSVRHRERNGYFFISTFNKGSWEQEELNLSDIKLVTDTVQAYKELLEDDKATYKRYLNIALGLIFAAALIFLVVKNTYGQYNPNAQLNITDAVIHLIDIGYDYDNRCMSNKMIDIIKDQSTEVIIESVATCTEYFKELEKWKIR